MHSAAAPETARDYTSRAVRLYNADMRKVLILGPAGAGKSTLAEKLCDLFKLELVLLDWHYWRPGWTRPTDEAWAAQLQDLLENLRGKDGWVMDGNYQSTLDLRIPHADTIIFLDVPRHVCLARILKRRLQSAGRKKPKREIAPGCFEKIDLEFLRYIWTFPRDKRPELLEKLEAHKHEKTIHILRTEKDIKKFLGIAQRS